MLIENYKFVCPIWIIPLHRKYHTKKKDCRHVTTSTRTEKKIGIIGAGAAGLVALKHSLDEHHECEVFEQTEFVGGTWNYTDKTGLNEFGLPIHSSMYRGLRTNLPKELMQFEDYPFSKPNRSYVSQPEVLEYINDYTTHFNLLPHIKFFSHVVKVTPLKKGRWSVDVQDLISRLVETKEFDAILVCVGNYSVPSMPTFPGLENFRGTIIHSHNFRTAEPYRNRNVLIIGGGASGTDIARLLKRVTNNVILCHRSPISAMDEISQKITKKCAIQEFQQHSVIFKDGSEESIDDVILCTGYLYSYPFLSTSCRINVENRWVKYLYKQILNINHPTMGFIGVPCRIFPFVIFGIQVRFFLAYLKGKFSFTKQEMLGDLQNYMSRRNLLRMCPSEAHFLGMEQGEYMEDLAVTANIKKIPPVFMKLYEYVHGEGRGKKHLSFRIINNEDFVIFEDCYKTSM